ncbi:MAG: relaxase/mobilization nuclease domain-containing protein [Silvanigrellaceae bacterium]|nr:relaxase/mobilization nuclease domain-containing protein [Silvanigrellaceae bacterium]
MTTNNDIEEGLLDDAGSSRRFVKHDKYEELKEGKRRKALNKSKKKASHPIDNIIKYGNKKNSNREYKSLSTAAQIRIAAGFQQAILKVTSYGKGFDKIFSHIAYITRDFDLPLEDQDRSLLKTRDEAQDLLTTWQAIFFDNRANSRDTVHMVFSAPPGTCRNTFKQLTREFLSEQYNNIHDYVFVEHNDTEHPHIHSILCLRSHNGQKLDPRKKYLNELRKQFAEKCREKGIMLDASRRFERGLAGQSSKSAFVQMREKRQTTPLADKRLINRVTLEIASQIDTNNTSDKLRKNRNQNIKSQFYKTAKKLYEAYMAADEGHRQDKDIQAAKLLFDYSKQIPSEMTRADYLKEILKKDSLQAFGKVSDFLGLSEILKKQQDKFKQKDLELEE